MIWALYIASVAGAASLYLMMPRRGYNPRVFGALLGAMTLGGLWLGLSTLWPEQTGLPGGALPFYYIFSGLAIVAAARVITHTQPLYSALWFIITVLSSAGLLLVLAAPFMMLAMVLVYAGAILVTYVFVMMLASQTGDSADPDSTPLYDRLPREPLAAVATGFLLLAALLTVAFAEPGPVAPPADRAIADQQALLADVLVDRTHDELLARDLPAAEAAALERRASVVDNVEAVGVDLFRSHPLGIELAGVILLVSLIGAVVIARTRVPEEIAAGDGPVRDVTGATAQPTHEPGPDDPQSQGQSGGRMGV